MAARTVTTLKFVGSISVGLLTGLSYTLSTITLPTLLHLPSASNASTALTSLTQSSTLQLRALTGLSATSFLLSYLLSPRSQRHPYLLWSTLFISSSLFTEYLLPSPQTTHATIESAKAKKEKAKRELEGRLGKSRQMDASYEVLSTSAGVSDRDSEGSEVEVDSEEDVNGEEVRQGVERLVVGSAVKALLSGVGFAMAVVGIWGDGVADIVVVA